MLGPLSGAAAAALGLPATTPVVAGAIDNTAAAIGSGAVDDFATHLYIGTSSWLATHVPFKKTDIFSGIASVPCAVPGRWLLTAMQSTAGGNLTFLRDNVLYHHDELLTEERLPDVFKIFDRMAARVPAGSNGVIYTPWIYGERAPVDDRALRAGLYNLSLDNTREDIVRAFLEGVALNTRWLMKPVEKFLGRPLTAINLVGGGGQSAVWSRIFADALGVEVRQVRDAIQANARGAAWIAAVGLGEIAFRDVPGLVGIEEVFEPQAANRAVYDERFAAFLEIHKRMRTLYRRLNRDAPVGAAGRAAGRRLGAAERRRPRPYPRATRGRRRRSDSPFWGAGCIMRRAIGEGEDDMQADRATDTYRVYGYRWVVLAVFMLVNLAIQMLWISYAPITSQAAKYYGVSSLAIGILVMTFMIAFIPLSLPAAWVIDTRGFRLAVGFGVVLMAVFGVARGLAGANYTLVLLSTIGLAVAQPFLLDAWTKVPANWFAQGERATAVGLVTLASMLGIAVGFVLTPILANAMSIARVQLVYGLFAAVTAVAFLVLARERPATPPCPPGMDERALMLDGLKHALTVKPFLVMLGVAFIVMSAFNGVTTWEEQIIKPRGFTSTEAGIMGGLMLIAGIIGAVVLSALSDRRGKRVRFMVIALVATVPGILGVAFVSSTLAALRLRRRPRLLPGGRAADRHAVRRRDHQPHAGGHVQRAHPALRAGLGGLRRRHGGCCARRTARSPCRCCCRRSCSSAVRWPCRASRMRPAAARDGAATTVARPTGRGACRGGLRAAGRRLT